MNPAPGRPFMVSDAALKVSALLLALAAVALMRFWHPQPPPDSHPALPPNRLPEGGDFILLTSAGTHSLFALRGRVVLVLFGHAACAGPCPRSLRQIAQAMRDLSASERAGIVPLFVAIDAEPDRVGELEASVQSYHPEMRAGAMTAKAVPETLARYGLGREARGNPSGPHSMGQASPVHVIDRAGNLQTVLPYGMGTNELTHALRQACCHT